MEVDLDSRRLRLRVGLVILEVGLPVVGGAAAVGGLAREYRDLQREDRLATTDGTVLETGLATAREVDGGGTEYYPRARYAYEVDGQRYESTRVYAPSRSNDDPDTPRGRGFDARAEAASVVDYDRGETVTVCYYPEDPATDILEPPTVDPLAVVLTAGAGLGFAVVGLAAAYAGVTGRLPGAF